MQATRRLSSFLRPYRLWVILAPLMMLGEVVGDLLQPRLTQRIIDQGIGNNDLGEVYRTGGLMILVAVIGMILGVLCGVFAVRAGLGFAADLRESLFRKVQSLSFANIDRLQTGSLITRLTTDVTALSDAVQMLLRIMVRAPLLLIGSLAMAIWTAPRLSLLFVVLLPILAVLIGITFMRAFPRFSLVQKKLDRINAIMQENLAGVRVVKAFARHDHESGRFRNRNDELRDSTLDAVYVIIMVMPLMMLIVNLGLVAAIWFGGHLVGSGNIEIGALIAFTNYLMQALFSLMMFSMVMMQFTRAEASAERVNEVLDSVPEIHPADAPQAEVPAHGKVEFRNVSFAYREWHDTPENEELADGQEPHRDEAVLHDISFAVEPGTTLAILGSTGSGKSTIVGLIPRFYDVTSGTVLVDDVDVRLWDEEALRQRVSIALQESVLFSGTIRDNIRFGNPDASDEEVERAARMAQADPFIQELANGYDSTVGQRGVNLSGGQKQRLAIARAIVRGASVLILDDSTSAVDVATERRIQAALADLPMTVILVAQRISAVVNADNIIVVDAGRIVAQGKHDDLLEHSDVFRAIYESQVESGAAYGAA